MDLIDFETQMHPYTHAAAFWTLEHAAFRMKALWCLRGRPCAAQTLENTGERQEGNRKHLRGRDRKIDKKKKEERDRREERSARSDRSGTREEKEQRNRSRE